MIELRTLSGVNLIRHSQLIMKLPSHRQDVSLSLIKANDNENPMQTIGWSMD